MFCLMAFGSFAGLRVSFLGGRWFLLVFSAVEGSPLASCLLPGLKARPRRVWASKLAGCPPGAFSPPPRQVRGGQM